MKLTKKLAEKMRESGIWIDYYCGFPRLSDYQIRSNNWRKMHHLPLIRRRKHKCQSKEN